jgi:hypothetical protein
MFQIFIHHAACFISGIIIGTFFGVGVMALARMASSNDDDLEGTFDERMESQDRPVRILGLDPRWERINQAFKETEIAE